MTNNEQGKFSKLVEKARVHEENKKLIGTIPITGILKKTAESMDSFVMIGYDVDDICPPWRRWPPGPWPPRQVDVFGPHPQPWIQKSIRIKMNDVVRFDVIGQTKDGEDIVSVFVHEQSVANLSIGIRLTDLVSLNPQPLPPGRPTIFG